MRKRDSPTQVNEMLIKLLGLSKNSKIKYHPQSKYIRKTVLGAKEGQHDYFLKSLSFKKEDYKT